MINLSFNDVVELRHSCRGFLPDEIPSELLTSILRQAQRSPSNCNTQPWNTHIVSGEKLKSLSQKLVYAFDKKEFSLDFTFDVNDFSGKYKQRQFEQGKLYHEFLGVDRDDQAGRRKSNLLNYKFYNAPHIALFLCRV
ncbi:nitroreductase family protein [Chryseobacterium hispalense]|uniref:nitroreductase family protein n=1 Tax=Chryseobacterium hispalense TaxID=1453492 RepID=UPI0021CD5F5C|nr:nitroreductase family protein [Chryseobacterium hispalense]